MPAFCFRSIRFLRKKIHKGSSPTYIGKEPSRVSREKVDTTKWRTEKKWQKFHMPRRDWSSLYHERKWKTLRKTVARKLNDEFNILYRTSIPLLVETHFRGPARVRPSRVINLVGESTLRSSCCFCTLSSLQSLSVSAVLLLILLSIQCSERFPISVSYSFSISRVPFN